MALVLCYMGLVVNDALLIVITTYLFICYLIFVNINSVLLLFIVEYCYFCLFAAYYYYLYWYG